jgi:hypothetical protein
MFDLKFVASSFEVSSSAAGAPRLTRRQRASRGVVSTASATMLILAIGELGCTKPNPARCDMDDCGEGGAEDTTDETGDTDASGDGDGDGQEGDTSGDGDGSTGDDGEPSPEPAAVRVDGSTNPPLLDTPKLLRLETDPVDGLSNLRFVIDDELELPATLGSTGDPFADWLVSGERFDGEHQLRVRGETGLGDTVEGVATVLDVDMPVGGTTIGLELVDPILASGEERPVAMALNRETELLTIVVERSGGQSPDLQALRFGTPALTVGASSDLLTMTAFPQRGGDVALHPDGGAVFVGWRSTTDDPLLVIEHRDADGVLVDDYLPPKPFGLASITDASVAVDEDGNIAYAFHGKADGGASLGEYGIIPASGGAIEQASVSALPHDVSFDDEGRILLTGTRDTGELWLLRTSLEGDIDVSAGAEFPGVVGRRVMADPNTGEIVVAGAVDVAGTDTEARVWVFSSDGTFVRSMPVVTTGVDEGVATDIAFDPLGDLVVLAEDGYSYDVASDLPDMLYVTKFTPDGSTRWTRTLTNGENIFSALTGASLAIDELGWLYVTGEDEDAEERSRIALRVLAP